MLRNLFIRLGLLNSILGITVLTILISILLTSGFSALIGDGPDLTGLWTAIFVPAIITPIFSSIFLRMLFQFVSTESQLRELNRRDSLTGVYNRAYFIELAERELVRTLRYGETFSIAIIDIDDFKRVNDTYGHLAGDRALQVISEVSLHNLRQTDTIARFGGDEFVVLFPYAGSQHVHESVDRIRRILANTPIPFADHDIHISVSAGTATYNHSHTDLDSILQQADNALYQAKNSGKNQVVVSLE